MTICELIGDSDECDHSIPAQDDVAEMFKISIHDIWVSQTSHLLDERTKINKEIKAIKEKVAYMVEMVSSKKIDPEDFRIPKY